MCWVVFFFIFFIFSKGFCHICFWPSLFEFFIRRPYSFNMLLFIFLLSYIRQYHFKVFLIDTNLFCVEGTTPYVLDEVPGTKQGRNQALPFVCALCLSLPRPFLQFISCTTFQGTNVFQSFLIRKALCSDFIPYLNHSFFSYLFSKGYCCVDFLLLFFLSEGEN